VTPTCECPNTSITVRTSTPAQQQRGCGVPEIVQAHVRQRGLHEGPRLKARLTFAGPSVGRPPSPFIAGGQN
jgi:hypothetical protein